MSVSSQEVNGARATTENSAKDGSGQAAVTNLVSAAWCVEEIPYLHGCTVEAATLAVTVPPRAMSGRDSAGAEMGGGGHSDQWA
jgi:hypothetical protein